MTRAHIEVICDATSDTQKEYYNIFSIHQLNDLRTNSVSYLLNNFESYNISSDRSNRKSIVIRLAQKKSQKETFLEAIIKIEKIKETKYKDSKDNKLTKIEFINTNYFSHDPSEDSGSMSIANYSKSKCLTTVKEPSGNTMTYPLNKSLTYISNNKLLNIICPKGTTGIEYIEQKSEEFSSKSTHLKSFTHKSNEITIDVTDSIFKNSKYYLVSELNNPPQSLSELRALKEKDLKAKEVVVVEDKAKATKTVKGSVKIENNKATNVRL